MVRFSSGETLEGGIKIRRCEGDASTTMHGGGVPRILLATERLNEVRRRGI